MSFFSKLEEIENKYQELEQKLSSPEVFQDREKYTEVAKAHSDLSDIVATFREYKRCRKELEENNELANDSDEQIRELAEQEISELEPKIEELETKLRSYLLPKDPLDDKSVIIEIRAGTGGEEASLFAADLLKMYMRYAEQNKWKVELINSHETGSGGFKEVTASVSGQMVYSKLKYEAGVHRVQRVPSTESQGRVHTSAVTVAILPEAEEVDVEIDPNELRVDVFRASGPGGQSVNTTESAIRVTHLPSGVVVNCQDEKSQHKNKAKAMTVLRSRLLQMKQDQAKQEEDESRRAQVGSGDRSERIRTYNFPQNRITDHRINLTNYNIESVMDGNLDEIIDPLIQNQKAEALKDLESR